MSSTIGIKVKVVIKKEFRDLFSKLDKDDYDYDNNRELCISLLGRINERACHLESAGGFDGYIYPNAYIGEISNKDPNNLFNKETGVFQFDAAISERSFRYSFGRYVKHFLGPIVDWNESYFIGHITEFVYDSIINGDYTASAFGFGGRPPADVKQSDYNEWTFNPNTGNIIAIANKYSYNTKDEQVLVRYPLSIIDGTDSKSGDEVDTHNMVELLTIATEDRYSEPNGSVDNESKVE